MFCYLFVIYHLSFIIYHLGEAAKRSRQAKLP